jgi:hypothetical protein
MQIGAQFANTSSPVLNGIEQTGLALEQLRFRARRSPQASCRVIVHHAATPRRSSTQRMWIETPLI